MATNFSLTREEDDPMALRASVGGDDKTGYYLVFRGDPEKVVKMLEEVTAVAKTALPMKRYADRRGRGQG